MGETPELQEESYNGPGEYFDQCTLSGDELESGVYQLSELIEVAHDGEIYGPLKLEDFRQAISEFGLNNNYHVKSFEDEDFVPLFEHSHFSRRKAPRLPEGDGHEVSFKEKSEEFYYLNQGQKWGPVPKDEIWALLKAKKLLMTDMVSPDEGNTWYRVYQIEQFDRRGKDIYDPLPGLPEWQVFKESNEEVNQGLRKVSDSEIETEAIAGLAFIGNINSGKAENKEMAKLEEKIESQRPKTSFFNRFKGSFKISIPEKYLWASLIFVSVIGLTLLLMPSKDSQFEAEFNKEEKAPVKAVTKSKAFRPRSKTQAVKPTFKPNTTSRVRNKLPARKPAFKPRPTPKSFLKSKSFKGIKERKPLADNPLQEKDDYYYDDGQDPVELDPIREKVAKETLDPAYEEEEDIYYEGDERAQKTKKPKRFIAADEEDNLIFVEDGEEVEDEF